MSLMIQSDSGQPALKAKAVSIGAGSLLFVGSSERDEVLTSAYNDQSFVRISDSLTLKAGQTVPSMQNANGMKFVAWRQKGSTDWDNAVWYRPGDVIEGNEKTLVAVYTSTYNLALIFDGNGGTTASGSKYYVTAASGGDLHLIDSPFTRDGYSLHSYNDCVDGSGTSYTAQQLVEKQDWFDVMAGKVLTFLSVNVGAANNSNLTDAQKNAITGARELSVIEVSLSSNGEKISNFNGGSVTIDVPFQWSMKGLLRAYYIDENGNKSAIDVTYKNGVATLVLNHFSTYVVEAVDALSFTDVSAKAYYFDAVAWAVKNKITSGQSDTLFAPDASCTRAQMVTFLWRANGSPAPKTTEMPFTDVSKDAYYYYDAVLWASENGITTGTGETTFSPNQVISRAEAVTFLWRADGKPIAEGSLFADVESTKYYAEAVRWAVTSGITNGMSDSTFAPNDICTRAHIVTFLYRTHRSK